MADKPSTPRRSITPGGPVLRRTPEYLPTKSPDGRTLRHGGGAGAPVDYTEENEYLKGRLEEQLKTITILRQKEVDQKLVSMSKDEFKKKNNELIEENERLQKENAKLVAETTKLFAADIEAKNKLIQELDNKSKALIAGYDEIQAKFSEIDSVLAGKDYAFTEVLKQETDRLNALQDKMNRVGTQLQSLRKNRAKRNSVANFMTDYLRERQEILEEIMDHGRYIQDRQKENFELFKEAEKLQMTADKLQEEIARMKL